jgi:cell division protein FtsW
MEDSIYRLRHRDILTLCVLSLLFLGVVMVQSASMNVTSVPADTPLTEFVAQQEHFRWQWTVLGMRHFTFAIVAIAVFFIVGHLDYQHLARPRTSIWKSPILWCLAVAAFTCVIVLIPGVGKVVNGARRWLPLGFTQVQPSELAKWSTVLFLAWWLTSRPVKMDSFFKGFVPTMIPVAAICLLVVIQDFGTAALIGLCALTMLLAGRAKWWHIAIFIPPAVGGALWFIMSEDYRWRRMTSFLNPWSDPRGEGYHMVQSLLSFATGGIAGRGLGNGVQKLGYLPEDTTDFIFTVICEELGLFGAMLTIALYLGILYIAWQIVKQNRDSFGRLLAFGIGSMIGLQAVINIAVATVSVPTKGLSLPLISAGGSGLVITCAALGLLYSITRHQHAPEPHTPAPAPEAPPVKPITEKIWKEFTVTQ